MNPSDINDYDTSNNMYQYLVNQRGMSDADAQAYIRQNLDRVNRAAVSSNTMANAAPMANERAASQAQREPVVEAPPQTPSAPPAPPADKYAGMTPPEALAAKAQDLATYKFWSNFQGSPETPHDQRRPSFQNMSGLAARAQAIDPEKAAEAQRLFDVNKQKIQNKDFDTWGRKVEGPSAATNSMDVTGDISSAPPVNTRAAIPTQPDGEYGYSGPMGDILQKALDVSRGPQGRVPEMLMPLNGAKDPRIMPIANGNNSPARQNQSNITALPVRRPDSMGQLPGSQPAQQEGFFARNFGKDPYAGQSAAQLMKTANENPDSAAAFFRADKALQKEQPDMFKPKDDNVPAEKRGGPVNGGKDAALHKALEIIHHMLMRGR
jgi:hypothetical protein